MTLNIFLLLFYFSVLLLFFLLEFYFRRQLYSDIVRNKTSIILFSQHRTYSDYFLKNKTQKANIEDLTTLWNVCIIAYTSHFSSLFSFKCLTFCCSCKHTRLANNSFFQSLLTIHYWTEFSVLWQATKGNSNWSIIKVWSK